LIDLTEVPPELEADKSAIARNHRPYDRRKLSYASSFTNPVLAETIRAIELFTGKFRLLNLIRGIERDGVRAGQAFWPHVLRHMDIRVDTPMAEIERIPRTGPVIIVSNHPHGLVDGMVFGYLIGQIRTDYKILTRSLLTEVDAIKPFMIPVPFPHQDGATERFLQMRTDAMAHLQNDGLIALFPSGTVAHSKSWFGPAIEAEWNPFTAKMIQKSGATVVPLRFQGSNSRAYQIAANTSAVVRQGLLVREMVNLMHKPMRPVIGQPIPPEELKQWAGKPREFMTWLREHTLTLKA
jgi:putative hemolysin